MENCQACKFYLAFDDALGLCRRFPAIPIVTSDGTYAQFSPMYNEGWCGEFKQKSGGQK